uniref:Retrovirus-related Pol polyprotein from transposon TNT 1-94-like beta-barrel domain-containing protein n=1 Tax=Fagus sylvatica TaxID=28930 RepID=A0A2N9I8X8_FAGSY
MGNDATCSVIEIGTVKIKMFDGVVRVFEDVRHISGLLKKLISLGVLDDLAYSYSSKGGVMKISKGTLLVMKERKVNQLYRCIRNTVLGGAVVITPTESSTDDTKLWHMRLGHIGEHGMLNLACEDSPKEKSTVEVLFDKDNLPSNKGNDEDDSQQQQQQEEPYSIARGREKQVHKAPQRYGFEDMVSFALVTSSGDPLSYGDATNKKHSDKWFIAMSEDRDGVTTKNKNWESAKFPKIKKASYWMQVGILQERSIVKRER